jgi:hypothetical protein
MSTSFNLQADQYAKKALQLCGVVGLGRPVDTEVLQDVRDTFSEILKTLQARGTTLTQKVQRTLALVPGVASYALPADLYDVEFPVTVQAANDVNETYVERATYADWRIISDKTVTGPPTRMYVERLSTMTAFLWSVPEKAYTLNYQGCQLLPDVSDGTTTPGLTQRWMGALTWRLAYWISFPLNIPQTKRGELKTVADEEERIVLGQDTERGDLQLMLPSDPYGSYT